MIIVIVNCVQSGGGGPGCFVILTASFLLNLAVLSYKRYRTGTVVPNTCGLTDVSTGSSIKTRIVLAAAIGTHEVTSTRNNGGRSLKMYMKKELGVSDRLKTSVFSCNASAKLKSRLAMGTCVGFQLSKR